MREDDHMVEITDSKSLVMFKAAEEDEVVRNRLVGEGFLIIDVRNSSLGRFWPMSFQTRDPSWRGRGEEAGWKEGKMGDGGVLVDDLLGCLGLQSLTYHTGVFHHINVVGCVVSWFYERDDLPIGEDIRNLYPS